jgi:hypothetical protein
MKELLKNISLIRRGPSPPFSALDFIKLNHTSFFADPVYMVDAPESLWNEIDHVGCRSVAGDALIINDAITKKLGIPILSLEWENFDPRVYHHEQYKTRLELFKSMIKTGR